ncbi:hypothetical protein GC174_09050 [bacterium]|nr:hypothetical protein [bacterium]
MTDSKQKNGNVVVITLLSILALILIGLLGYAFSLLSGVVDQRNTASNFNARAGGARVQHIQHSPTIQVYEFFGTGDGALKKEADRVMGIFSTYVARYELDESSELSRRFQKEFGIKELPAYVVTDNQRRVLTSLSGKAMKEKIHPALKKAVFGEGSISLP